MGRTTSGVEGGTASCRSNSGNEVDGEDGRSVSIGVGDDVDSDKGKREASPRGIKRMISAKASSVNYSLGH